MWTYFQRAREPIDSFTHFIGILLAGAGTLLVVTTGLIAGTPRTYAAAGLVFCISMLALYTASSVYHYYNGRADRLRRLRKFDHSMIYVLIAGTYTPIYFRYQPLPHALVFMGGLWGIAIAGILVKMCWITAPNWLSAAVYILMGWALVFDFSIFAHMPAGMTALLATGGVSYTVGGVMYALKKPDLWPNFGHHELFHIFVLVGTFFHFLAIYFYVIL